MKRFLTILSVTGFTILAVAAIVIWYIMFRPNVADGKKIFIPSGAGFDTVTDSIASGGILKNIVSFSVVARIKHYDRYVKPGCYTIKRGMSNNSIINILKSGRQTPVKVTFNNVRTLTDLAHKVGGQIEADSSAIMHFLSDPRNYQADGFTHETIISVFIPDTYELYWTTDAPQFYRRMLSEFRSFWNEERLKKAGGLHLTPVEVSIIASIIDDEVRMSDEKPRIAGVYLNRLRIGMPLQACPTIKFALNDFTIRRVLDEHLKVESPYNTYRYRGLPPGPVRCPSKISLDAVLNAEKHDFLYFAAKADFSGYHHFSRTLAEHNRYASEYHRELNRRDIYR